MQNQSAISPLLFNRIMNANKVIPSAIGSKAFPSSECWFNLLAATPSKKSDREKQKVWYKNTFSYRDWKW